MQRTEKVSKTQRETEEVTKAVDEKMGELKEKHIRLNARLEKIKSVILKELSFLQELDQKTPEDNARTERISQLMAASEIIDTIEEAIKKEIRDVIMTGDLDDLNARFHPGKIRPSDGKKLNETLTDGMLSKQKYKPKNYKKIKKEYKEKKKEFFDKAEEVSKAIDKFDVMMNQLVDTMASQLNVNSKFNVAPANTTTTTATTTTTTSTPMTTTTTTSNNEKKLERLSRRKSLMFSRQDVVRPHTSRVRASSNVGFLEKTIGGDMERAKGKEKKKEVEKRASLSSSSRK